MEIVFIVLCIVLIGFAVLFISSYFRRSHRRRRKEARSVYRNLQQVSDPRIKFSVLRQMDAFAFEELVLYALRKKGYLAWHGRRYTGDGGIDGYVIVNRRKCLIQDKRYRNAINPDHVEAFSELCKARGCRGFFVHTGRTGKMSKVLNDERYVLFISGENLLKLLDRNSGQFPL